MAVISTFPIPRRTTFEALFEDGQVIGQYGFSTTSTSGGAAPPFAQQVITRHGGWAMECPLGGSGPFRSEVAIDNNRWQWTRPGDVTFWGFSIYYPTGFPDVSVNGGFQATGQWHQDNGTVGSPPIAIYVNYFGSGGVGAPGEIWIGGGGGGAPPGPVTYDKWGQKIADTTYDVWHDFVVKIDWGTTVAGSGSVTVWHDSVKVVDTYSPPTTPLVYPNTNGGDFGINYLKHGYYRNSPYTQTVSVYHDCIRLGATYDDVDPSVP